MIFVETVTGHMAFVYVQESDNMAKVRREIVEKRPSLADALPKNYLFFNGNGPLEATQTVKEAGISEAYEKDGVTPSLRGKERVKVRFGGRATPADLYLEPSDTVSVIKEKIEKLMAKEAEELELE